MEPSLSFIKTKRGKAFSRDGMSPCPFESARRIFSGLTWLSEVSRHPQEVPLVFDHQLASSLGQLITAGGEEANAVGSNQCVS